MICGNFSDSNDAQEEDFERRNITDQEDEEYPQELDDEIAAYRKKLLKASENIEIAEDVTAKKKLKQEEGEVEVYHFQPPAKKHRSFL